VNEEVPPLPASVSPAMAGVVMDLLEKSPRKRPKSAAELEQILTGLRLPTEAELRARTEGLPGTIEPRRPGGAPKRVMPPSIAPKSYRPRPDAPPKRPW